MNVIKSAVFKDISAITLYLGGSQVAKPQLMESYGMVRQIFLQSY